MVSSVGAKWRLIFISVFSVSLVGCKTVQPICTISKHDTLVVRDSVIVSNFERVVDSVRLQGDTIHHYHIQYIYMNKEKWREKNEVRKDSVREVGKTAPKAPKSDKKNSVKWWLYPLVLLVGFVLGVKRSR